MIIINTILFCSIIGLILNFILYIKNSKQSKLYSIKFIKDIKVSSNKWIIRYSIIIINHKIYYIPKVTTLGINNTPFYIKLVLLQHKNTKFQTGVK